jgi:hypothetical protein
MIAEQQHEPDLELEGPPEPMWKVTVSGGRLSDQDCRCLRESLRRAFDHPVQILLFDAGIDLTFERILPQQLEPLIRTNRTWARKD